MTLREKHPLICIDCALAHSELIMLLLLFLFFPLSLSLASLAGSVSI